MDQINEVKHSLSENWAHQRDVSDALIKAVEKVDRLEKTNRAMWQFIAALVLGGIGGIVTSIYSYGEMANQVANHTISLEQHDTRIRGMAPVINGIAADIEAEIDVLTERINDHHVNHPVGDHKHD